MERHGFIVVRGILLVLIGAFVALPLYWAFIVSSTPLFKLLYEKKIFFLSFTLDNYRMLFTGEWGPGSGYSFLLPLWNSLIIALGTTLISISISLPAAYALVMMSFREKSLFSTFILLAYVFPPFIIIIAVRFLIIWLGVHDTLYGLMLLHCVLTVPYCTWILRAYFLTVPRDIDEAAMIDGCTRLQALFRVILPVALPGVMTAITFSFTLSWQDLLFAIISLDSDTNFTIPMALVNMIQGDFIQWGKLMAGAVISTIPPVILYLLLQRYITSGLTGGALKG